MPIDRTFGPAIERRDDGSLKPLCTWCIFRIGTGCTYSKPTRTLPDGVNTPEWCVMLDDMLAEVAAQPARKP